MRKIFKLQSIADETAHAQFSDGILRQVSSSEHSLRLGCRNRERRHAAKELNESFRHCWMGKYVVTQGGVGKACNHCDLHCRHDFPRLDRESGETEDAISCSVNQGLHETTGLGKGSGSQYGQERDFRQSIRNATPVGFSFTKSNASKFGVSENAEGHLAVGCYAMSAQDIVVHDVEVIFRDVCKVWASGTFSGGPNIGCRGFQAF